MRGKGVYKTSRQSAFYKIGSHRKLFKCKTLKIQSKLPEDDGKMLDNVS